MIDFDDMSRGDGDALDGSRDPNAPPPALGLVVAESAPSGAVITAEAATLRDCNFVPVFIEEDDDGVERFGNAATFAQRMSMVSLPSEAEAAAWMSDRMADAFEKHRAAIVKAYRDAYADKP